MQNSATLNETRVPRQVSERLKRSIDRYATLGAPEPDAQTQPANGAPATPPTPPAPPTGTPANPPTGASDDSRYADPSYWQQRFDVTFGILAREREQRVNERNDLNSRITELQTEVQSLKQAAPPAEIDLAAFYTPAEIEAYGEPQCRVMAQTAMKAATAEAKKLIDAEVRPLKQKAETAAADDVEARKQKFRDQLTELVPDWQITDDDKRWLAWLDESDENGVARDVALQHHIRTSNVKGAAKMFQAFAKTIVVPVPPVTPSGSGAGAGEGGNPPAGQGLVAPTDAEVKDFYKRSALGKVKDAERVEFEARLKLRNPAR